jgi:hypothetical protein
MIITVTAYLCVFFIVLAFIADHLPFVVIARNITSLGVSSFQTIRSESLEDTQKEKLLLNNSLDMFMQSMKMLAFILVIVLGGLLLLLTSGFFSSLSYWALVKYIVTFNGLLLSVASFLTYYLLKRLYVRIRL